uniref:Heat shock 70 kDa protein 12A n=1 Tax=Magallana gigas TaxID=29159 RepID=A0A8W8L1S1_MAGGI|nr:heat shock 70 kDa protein 12B [Crassostrea gigas]XP_034302027.1 heat shock 70 kDa protein 12B [Crassostrea gigas]
MASGLEEIEPDSGLGKRTSSLSIHGHREDGEKNARESKIVIAAIDFGTTYSGYAYIFRDELDKANNSSEKRNVIYKHWQSGSDAGICSRKTPTCLLLNPKGEFDSFGYPAEGKYYNLTNDDAHHGWKFFKRFKMILLNEKNLSKETMIPDDQNNMFKAIDVFALSLKFIKDDLDTDLKKTGYDIEKEEIQWVITIPAIWNPRSKQFMRMAAEKAGIKGNQMEFALEPEAAAVFVKETKVAKQKVSDDEHALVPFQVGTRFMVLDLGGGTIDISVKEVLTDRALKELHRASGNGLGGDSINLRFFGYFKKVFGSKAMSIFKNENKHKAALYDLESEIELKKRNLDFDQRGNIRLSIPPILFEIFEEFEKKDFDEYIGTLKGLSFKKGKMFLNQEIVTEIFKPSVTSLVQLIQEIIAQEHVKKISDIIMVGGYSQSRIISKTIKDLFEHKNVNVIIPNDPDLAVLQGAVMYRYWPEVVRTRRSPYTYGTRLLRLWLEGDDESKKIRRGKSKEVFCGDHFEKFVSLNDEFETGQTETLKVYPVEAETTEMAIDVYTSNKSDPRYTTDTGCEKLGRLVVHVPDTTKGLDRHADVTMTMGSTEIVVQGKMMPDGTPTKVVFDMLSAK